MQTLSPTGSYLIDLPEDILESREDDVISFWREGEDVLLQLSSMRRAGGLQVTAEQRLRERLAMKELVEVQSISIGPSAAPQEAAAMGLDVKEGDQWVYCYLVWPTFAIFVTISSANDLTNPDAGWAFEALRSIRTAST